VEAGKLTASSSPATAPGISEERYAAVDSAGSAYLGSCSCLPSTEGQPELHRDEQGRHAALVRRIHANAQQEGAEFQPLHGKVTFAGLETIAGPTLMMPGDCDLTTPPYIMRRPKAHMPKAQFVLVP